MRVNKKEIMQIKKQIYPATLVAATKYIGIKEIEELEALGVTIFGENKVQSLLEKYEQYHGNGAFHMIGTLQKNKVKYIIDKVKLIHSVDTISLLEEIQKQAVKHNLVMPVLLQVNIAMEESKHGFTVEELEIALERSKALNNVDVRGLMMMAPNRAIDEIEIYFEQAKKTLEQLQIKYPLLSLTELSMGMSNDYLVALKYGSTYIRIGSALFE